MANPKVSKKDAEFSNAAPAALRNIAGNMRGYVEREWTGTFPSEPGLEIGMAFLTSAGNGIRTINDILAAQRTVELINSCRGPEDQLVGLPDNSIEGLHAALSALAEAVETKMFGLMDHYSERASVTERAA